MVWIAWCDARTGNDEMMQFNGDDVDVPVFSEVVHTKENVYLGGIVRSTRRTVTSAIN